MNVTVWRGDSAELPVHRQPELRAFGFEALERPVWNQRIGAAAASTFLVRSRRKPLQKPRCFHCSGSAGSVVRAGLALRSKARSPVLLPGQPSPASRLPQLLAEAFQLLRKPAAPPRGGPLL